VGLAAQLSKKEIGSRVSEFISQHDGAKKLQTQVEQATKLVDSLGRLKGAAMKVGQLLSIEAADFLPPEVIEVLAKLQDKAPPVPFAELAAVVREDLGEATFARLELEETALACASIGQVHRARFQNQDVAIKIQYPGINDSICADLIILRRIVQAMLIMGGRRMRTDALFAELEAVLKQEVDYAAEARMLGKYANGIRSLSGFRVPTVVPELVGPRVLGMSFEPGLKIQEWLDTNPGPELREYFGRQILDLYTHEFFEMGLVQSDPNFANFLFRPDTRELVLLDFGATRRYSPEFRADYSKLLHLVRSGSFDSIVAHSMKMGFIMEGESKECLEDFVAMLTLSTEPFNPRRQPFDFSDLDYAKEVRRATGAFTSKVRHTPPPHTLIFLHRKLGGIFSLIKKLNVTIDLLPYWKHIVG